MQTSSPGPLGLAWLSQPQSTLPQVSRPLGSVSVSGPLSPVPCCPTHLAHLSSAKLFTICPRPLVLPAQIRLLTVSPVPWHPLPRQGCTACMPAPGPLTRISPLSPWLCGGCYPQRLNGYSSGTPVASCPPLIATRGLVVLLCASYNMAWNHLWGSSGSQPLLSFSCYLRQLPQVLQLPGLPSSIQASKSPVHSKNQGQY